jgi:uncharacterized damage-inducible protein DinB
MAATPKQQFLDAYEREHALTMKLLRAYPAAKGDLKPHARLRSARDLAWIFVLERGLGTTVLKGEFGATPRSALPPAPAWNDILPALEKTHQDFATFLRSLPDAKLDGTFKFLTGPKQVGEVKGLDFLWFLLADQIHHRGQLSVYLRLADGKVPSIYGPSGDEPWM